MATDPALPASLAAEVADLKRRLDNLERSPKLPYSSTRGGSFQFRDSSNSPRLVLGNVDLAALNDGDITFSAQEKYGVFVFGDGGTVGLWASEGSRGLVYPMFNIAFHKTENIAVTSATFVNLFENDVRYAPGDVIRVQMSVITDSGTTGEVKIVDSISATSTTALTLPSATNGRADFQWLHPGETGMYDNRASRDPTMQLNIQARRTSGAGNVYVYAPLRQWITSSVLYPDADVNGHATLLT